MNARKTRNLLIFMDWFMALMSWTLFFYYRKVMVEEMPLEVNDRFYLGISLIPFFWLLIYFFLGTYHNVKRLYLMKVLSLSLTATFLGTIILFFLLILDDKVANYYEYYTLVIALFIIHFSLTILPRLIITLYIVRKIHARKWGFNTLLIGGSQKAVEIYKEIESLPKGIGNRFIGFVNLNGIDVNLKKEIKHLGAIDKLEDIIEKNNVEEVIIALESKEHEKLKQLIAKIQGRNVRIKIIPDMFDLLSGSVKMNNIFGAMLIEIDQAPMPLWQFILKRFMDILFSLIALIILIPVYIALAVVVKSSSKGPVFFKQERIGKKGVPFKILKFRTMIVNAEAKGPQLSSSNDPRITKSGKFMRKMRLDELPQFWNVLVGEMSLVGPRPERQFFIDKIAEKEPQFLQLTMVKPGITSWGQVKFGYAENVDEMVQRMKYDLLYLKNMSIALDFKILLYTVIIVFKGSGK